MFDTKVKLYKKGIIPLSEFITMDRDRDILEEIIVAKDGRRAVYLSERRSQTDFPVLTCAASCYEGIVMVSIGARPMRATVTETTLDEMEHIADASTMEAICGAAESTGSTWLRFCCAVQKKHWKRGMCRWKYSLN